MLWSDRRLKLTGKHKRTLRALAVDEDGPGTVLPDFETLLAFVRGRDLQVSQTYHLLPRVVLPEVNAQLAHPIQLGLKRPQLKSYPHIQGLYLLLRATGLAFVGGTPSKPVLTIDEALYDAWSNLNPAERYFTLLEAWLLRGRPEIVGETGGPLRFLGQHFADCAELIRRTPPEGLLVAGGEGVGWFVRYSPGRMGIALLELFGLLAVEHGPPEAGEGWQIERVYRTSLGEAVFALLYEEIFGHFDRTIALEETPHKSFGELQPIFQPYVPAWRNNFSVPPWAFRDGLHVFKVSLGRDLWRRIAVPAGLSLDDLAHAVLNAYDFDHHPSLDEGPWTSEVRIGDVPLPLGQAMTYLYDFGDCWRFAVTLERVDPADTPVKEPTTLDGRGDAPDQYPVWDEGEW